jgi:hypothetical protein
VLRVVAGLLDLVGIRGRRAAPSAWTTDGTLTVTSAKKVFWEREMTRVPAEKRMVREKRSSKNLMNALLSGLRVLVVDDNADSAEALAALFT